MIELVIVSRLLEYPDAALVQHQQELFDALASSENLDKEDAQTLSVFLRDLLARDLLDAQADYSQLFDRGRATSLLLFEHVHGESRDRGQAMVDLRESYAASGMDCSASELPDYVPLFLEFVSAQPTEEDAKRVLAEVGGVLRMMERRFIDRKHPYAPLITILRTLSGAAPRLVTTEKIAIRAEDN